MKSDSPFHWSKDYVEHLRAVHFALIGLSLGLVLIVASARSYNPNVALKEIEQILQLRKEWSYAWIMQHVPQEGMSVSDKINPKLHLGEQVIQLVGGGEGLSDFSFDLVARGQNRPLILSFPETNMVLTSPNEPSDEEDSDEAEFPNRLSDFEEWWDAMPFDSYLPTDILEEGVVSDEKGGWSRIRLDKGWVDDQVAAGQRKIKLRLVYAAQDKTFYYTGRDAETGNSYTLVVKGVMKGPIFHDLFRGYGWQNAPFNASFSDLANAANGFENFPLDRVQQLVSDSAGRGNEVFEVFGIKFPADQLNIWGVLLVLSVQLYFLLYLRQLTGKLRPGDPGWDVPWVGMDQSLLGAVLFFVTVVMLPMLALSLLASLSIRPLWVHHWRWTPLFHFVAGPLHNSGRTIALTVLLWTGIVGACLYLTILSWRSRPQASSDRNSESSSLPEAAV